MSTQTAKAVEEQRKAAEEQAKDQEPERLGDVLGLSDASPDVEIPRATQDRSGNPAGIEVRTPTTGTADLTRGSGATGAWIGAGETGTDIRPDQRRPAAVREDGDK